MGTVRLYVELVPVPTTLHVPRPGFLPLPLPLPHLRFLPKQPSHLLRGLTLEIGSALAQFLGLPLSPLYQLLKVDFLGLCEALPLDSPASCLDILEIRMGSWLTFRDVRRVVCYAPPADARFPPFQSSGRLPSVQWGALGTLRMEEGPVCFC